MVADDFWRNNQEFSNRFGIQFLFTRHDVEFCIVSFVIRVLRAPVV